MKIEVFILPKDGEVRLAPTAPATPAPTTPAPVNRLQPKRTFDLGAPWKLAVLSVLLVCIFTACGMAAYSAYKAISAMDQLSARRSTQASVRPCGRSAPAEDNSRVRHFDNSRPLQRGDVVVSRQNGGANVGQVAVAENSAGLMKRGNAVEGLYVLGQDRYLVSSERGTRVVQGHEIIATVGSSAQPQR